MSELKFFNSSMIEYPTYLIILNKHKLRRIMNAWVYKLKKNMLIQNDIYIMMDDYNHLADERLLFYNNEKKYKTIYKRLCLRDKNLYIPIEEYSKYYLTFKTKICTSIVENLGVSSIEFKHNEFSHSLINVDSHLTVNNLNNQVRVQSEVKDNYKNDDTKLYNKAHCKFLFCDTEEFEENIKNLNNDFLNINEFNSDLELRNLIRSRLIGNLIEYDLKYEIEFMNSIEVDLATSFMNNNSIGVSLKKMANKKLTVSLHIKFYKYSELINNDNIQLNEQCLKILVNRDEQEIQNEDKLREEKETVLNKRHNLLNSFVDRFIEKYHREKLFQYKIIKIADQSLIDNLIKNIRTMEDLSSNGFFINSFTSILVANLLTFDDEGLQKMQKIYIWIKRHFPQVEQITHNINNGTIDVDGESLHKCYNIRCSSKDCDNPLRAVKKILSYIVRVYNRENPSKILTYGLSNSAELLKVLRYITLNLKHFTSYEMFANFTVREINKYREIIGENETYLDQMIDVITRKASKNHNSVKNYIYTLSNDFASYMNVSFYS